MDLTEKCMEQPTFVCTMNAKCKMLATLGLDTVSTLMSLLAPDQPEDKPLTDRLDILEAHFKPAPKAIAERFKFTCRRQNKVNLCLSFWLNLEN